MMWLADGMHAFVINVLHPLGDLRGRFRLDLDESPVSGAVLNVVRIVAFGADEPALLARAGPFANALAVNAVSPVTQFVAVTFAAQTLRLIKADRIAKVVYQLVALGCVVAIEAPDTAATMLQVLGILQQGFHHRKRPWLLVLRKRWRNECGTNSVVTSRPAHRQNGQLLGARLDYGVSVGNRVHVGHIAERYGALKRVAPPEHRTGFRRTLHIRQARLKVMFRDFGRALSAFEASDFFRKCRRYHHAAKHQNHCVECNFFHDLSLTVLQMRQPYRHSRHHWISPPCPLCT